MTEDSRTLEQRIDHGWNAFVWYDGTNTQSHKTRRHAMSKSLEAAGLPDLLAERDAALERVKDVERCLDDRQVSINFHSQQSREFRAQRDAAQAALDDGVKEFEAVVAERDALLEQVEEHQAVMDEVGAMALAFASCRTERDAAQAAAREMAKALAMIAKPATHDRQECALAALAAHPGWLEEGS